MSRGMSRDPSCILLNGFLGTPRKVHPFTFIGVRVLPTSVSGAPLRFTIQRISWRYLSLSLNHPIGTPTESSPFPLSTKRQELHRLHPWGPPTGFGNRKRMKNLGQSVV